MKIPRARIAALALAATLAAAGYATLVTAGLAAQAIVKPGATYQMYGNDCRNSPCGERVTITSNPNNAAVRAEVDCISNGGDVITIDGGWHTSVGATSATAECPSGYEADNGWEVWNMTQHNLALCYARPDPWNGGC